MKYTTAQGEKSTVKITITLTAKEWNEMQDKAYEKNKGRYQIPGFRKGHVPKAIIEQHYGKGAFYEEGINEAFGKYYYDVLDKEPTIEPVDRPDVAIDKLDAKGLTMTATVPVKPDVKLGDYKGIKIKKVEYNVTDADVQTEVDRFLARTLSKKKLPADPRKTEILPLSITAAAWTELSSTAARPKSRRLLWAAARLSPGSKTA